MTIKNRLAKLEAKRAPKAAPNIRVIIYGHDGRVMSGRPEYVGKTQEEIAVIQNVRYASDVEIYIPDNGRGDVQP